MRVLPTSSQRLFVKALWAWAFLAMMAFVSFLAPTAAKAEEVQAQFIRKRTTPANHDDWTEDTKRRFQIVQDEASIYFLQTDWDYPFILKGFDKDILDCLTITPLFEGYKLCVSCLPRKSQAAQETQAGQAMEGPAPSFDAVAFLNKRYGYRPDYQGVLRAPLDKDLAEKRYSPKVPWYASPTENRQYVVPTFSQAYYHNGAWRYLLVVSMYYERGESFLIYPQAGDKSTLPELDPNGYVAFSFERQGKTWRLLREKKVAKGHYPISMSYAPGNGILRLWKMPNGGYALLNMQIMVPFNKIYFVTQLYVLDQDGNPGQPVELETAYKDYNSQFRSTWTSYSTLSALKLRQGLEFVQTAWSEDQGPDKPSWSSDTHTQLMRLENGKLQGVFRNLWLYRYWH